MHSNSAGLGGKRALVRPEHLNFFESIAGHLGALRGLATEQLKGLTKADPATGVAAPVPFATIQVVDADYPILGFFPVVSPWGWAFPFPCRSHSRPVVSCLA